MERTTIHLSLLKTITIPRFHHLINLNYVCANMNMLMKSSSNGSSYPWTSKMGGVKLGTYGVQDPPSTCVTLPIKEKGGVQFWSYTYTDPIKACPGYIYSLQPRLPKVEFGWADSTTKPCPTPPANILPNIHNAARDKNCPVEVENIQIWKWEKWWKIFKYDFGLYIKYNPKS